MPFMLKTLLVLLSGVLAGAIWFGLIEILIRSQVSALQSLAVYLSHWFIFGWLLFLTLVISTYRFLSSRLKKGGHSAFSER
jgi:hypothetical protein